GRSWGGRPRSGPLACRRRLADTSGFSPTCWCTLIRRSSVSPDSIGHRIEFFHGKQSRAGDIKSVWIGILAYLLSQYRSEQNHSRTVPIVVLPNVPRNRGRLLPPTPIVVVPLEPEHPIDASPLQVVGFHSHVVGGP